MTTIPKLPSGVSTFTYDNTIIYLNEYIFTKNSADQRIDPISLETLEKDAICVKIDQCRHIFFKNSLYKWSMVKQSCPICRCEFSGLAPRKILPVHQYLSDAVNPFTLIVTSLVMSLAFLLYLSPNDNHPILLTTVLITSITSSVVLSCLIFYSIHRS